jgi:hypothetical protein
MDKIKKFGEENLVLEEIHVNDHDTILTLGREIQMIIPTFDMRITGNYGEIKIDGMVRFTTQGHETVAAITAYMSGLYTGLKYKK